MDHSTNSTPPNLVILSADLVARRASELLAQLAYAGTWEPADALKQALETYAAVRTDGAIAVAQAAPDCTICRIGATCLTMGDSRCDDFEPITQRSLAEHECRGAL